MFKFKLAGKQGMQEDDNIVIVVAPDFEQLDVNGRTITREVMRHKLFEIDKVMAENGLCLVDAVFVAMFRNELKMLELSRKYSVSIDSFRLCDTNDKEAETI